MATTATARPRKPTTRPRVPDIMPVAYEDTALLLSLATPMTEQAPMDDYVIRCICGDDDDVGFQIQCEQCSVWQHGVCVGYPTEDDCPDHYYCEECDPRGHPALYGAYEDRMTPKKRRSGTSGRKKRGVRSTTQSSPTPGDTARSSGRTSRSKESSESVRASMEPQEDEDSADEVVEAHVVEAGQLETMQPDVAQEDGALVMEEDVENNAMFREPELNGAGKPIRERKPRQLGNMVRYTSSKMEGQVGDGKGSTGAGSGTAKTAAAIAARKRKATSPTPSNQAGSISGKEGRKGVSGRKRAKGVNGTKEEKSEKVIVSSSRGGRRVGAAGKGRWGSAMEAESEAERGDMEHGNGDGDASNSAPPSFKPRTLPVRASAAEMQRRVKEMLRYVACLHLDLSIREVEPVWAITGDDEIVVGEQETMDAARTRREDLLASMKTLTRDALQWQQRWDSSVSAES